MGMFWDSATEKAARRNANMGAAGMGPSAARSQLAQGLAQTQNGMMAQAAGVRQNPLAAMRVAQQQGAQMAGQQNMQAAQLRGQEQLQGQQQQMQIAQQDAAAQQALVGGLMNMGGAALSGGLSAMGPSPAPQQPVTSDIRAKKQIQPGENRTDELLRTLASSGPSTFQYRDQNIGQGPQLGVMAQDVQRAAPELVREGPGGNLQIDGPGALGASLAANARLAQRLDAIERHIRPPTAENKGKFDAGGPGDNPDSFENARGAERTNPVLPPPPMQPSGPVPPEVMAARRQQADMELARDLQRMRTSPVAQPGATFAPQPPPVNTAGSIAASNFFRGR